MADHNPFEAGDNNPFEDPSVQSASEQQVPEMYNPFDGASAAQPSYGTSAGDNKKKSKKKKADNRTAPAAISEDSAWPSAAENAAARVSAAGAAVAATGAAVGDAVVREQALLRKEAELRAKEAELAERERALGRLIPNFPSKCYAVTYHNIEEEIPLQHQPLQKKFFLLLYLTWIGLFFNWICVIVILIDSTDDAVSFGTFLWASVYLVLGLPGSFILWYRSIYQAHRDDVSGKWMFFFLNFLIHTCFAILMTVGLTQTSSIGLIEMLKLFSKKHATVGIFALVNTFVWGLDAISSVVLLQRSHSVWRGQGGAEKARRDANAAQAVARVMV